MQLDEPSIAFDDSNNRRIPNEDLPQDKPSFGATFSTVTRRKWLHCHFVIQSNRCFHQINLGVWTLLQQQRVWLDKTPGTIQKTDLVRMDFWLHVHPGFASTRAFHSQVCKELLTQYATTNLALLHLPDIFAEPEIFFTSAKSKGSCEDQDIQTNTLTMYGTRKAFDHMTTMLTRLSSSASADDDKLPLYVPFALKRSHPEFYGQYLEQQNAFLKTQRNISIVGLHPDAKDYGDETSPNPAFPDSIWQTLSQMDAVYRVDPCCPTADLGKWNIPCFTIAHPDITNWIDNYLVDIWQQIATVLPPHTEFPTPERLSRNRAPRSSRSVASGLTNASPIFHYLQTLASRHQSSTKLATVIINPWRQTPPVASVQYEFHNTEPPYPPTHKTATKARTTKSTVAGTSAVTAATLQDDFNAKLQDIEAARLTTKANFQSRMNDMDDTIAKVHTHLDEIAATVTAQVLVDLQEENGLLWTQDKNINQLQEKVLPPVKQAINLPPGTAASPRHPSPHSPLRKTVAQNKTQPWTWFCMRNGSLHYSSCL
jgi:hypothetical protein